MAQYILLSDEETYTGIEGCKIIDLPDDLEPDSFIYGDVEFRITEEMMAHIPYEKWECV